MDKETQVMWVTVVAIAALWFLGRRTAEAAGLPYDWTKPGSQQSAMLAEQYGGLNDQPGATVGGPTDETVRQLYDSVVYGTAGPLI